MKDEYFFRIKTNGETVFEAVNNEAQDFDSVDVFSCSDLCDGANAQIGQLCIDFQPTRSKLPRKTRSKNSRKNLPAIGSDEWIESRKAIAFDDKRLREFRIHR